MSFPWRTLTVISLAINLLIVGAAVGFFMSHFPRGGPPFGGLRGAQGMGLRALPDGVGAMSTIAWLRCSNCRSRSTHSQSSNAGSIT